MKINKLLWIVYSLGTPESVDVARVPRPPLAPVAGAAVSVVHPLEARPVGEIN